MEVLTYPLQQLNVYLNEFPMHAHMIACMVLCAIRMILIRLTSGNPQFGSYDSPHNLGP